MKRRQWTAKEKLTIVLQGLKGEISVAELCNQHQISQSQYYKWRDRLLAEGPKVFEHGGPDRAELRLQKEVRKLKGIIGDLTVELKKSEYEDGGLL
jgi:transposase